MNDLAGAQTPEVPRLCGDTLALVLETGVRIRRRHQFFAWSQGVLKALLPHDVLVCATGRYGAPTDVDLVSSRPPGPALLSEIRAIDGGLVDRLQREWERNGREPVAFEPDSRSPVPLGHVIAHGVHAGNGYPQTLFAFCGVPENPRSAHLHALELLAPYLHAAWLRSADAVPKKSSPSRPGALTRRERQILRWVQAGKSNPEIGEVLGISQFTVKNHVKNILRKLGAHNRAQAVAKAAYLDLDDDRQDARAP